MNNIIFRLAKPCDAYGIAKVHFSIRERYVNGIFTEMGFMFLKKYYQLILNEPNEIIVCAEKNGQILGFNSVSLNAECQIQYLRKHKLDLALAAITSLVRKPKLLVELYKRYKSVQKKNDKDVYVVTSGARGEYWAWVADDKDPEASIEMHNITHRICALLGYKEICIEVDTSNKSILRFHKLNGAKEVCRHELPDGRVRVILKYQY